MLEQLKDNPYAWAVLALVAIMSLVYAIICQHKNKKKFELTYVVKSNELIRNSQCNFEKLSIFYDGKSIDNLCVSKIAIWNSGNTLLNKSDIVDGKELTISTSKGNMILEINIISKTEDTNNFSIISVDEQTKIINFDYADIKDGITIQAIHTGGSKDIDISCKIKGGRPLKTFGTRTTLLKIPKAFTSIYMFVISVITSMTTGILLVTDILIANNVILVSKNKALLSVFSINPVAGAILSVLMIIICFFMILSSVRMMKDGLKIGIPYKLKRGLIYEDDK